MANKSVQDQVNAIVAEYIEEERAKIAEAAQ